MTKSTDKITLKRLFADVTSYPSPSDFSTLPDEHTFQPENQTRYSGSGRNRSIEQSKEWARKISPELVG